ncbi:MAG TPA: diacylglycerol kinase family protein [Bdellovibrionota bacterium]|nr:diacylglycerol kinase family protein [Bdellovibrionota bacterium]
MLTVVLNPKARRCPSNIEAGAGLRVAKAAGPGSEIRITRTLDELDQLLTEISDRTVGEPGTVCFYGGDGSVGRGLTAWVRARGEELEIPPLLAVRGGTINFLSSWLGIRGRPERTLSLWREGGMAQLRTVPTLRVDLGPAGVHYGFVLVWGVGERVLRRYYSRSEQPGFWDASLVAAQTVLRALTGRDRELFARSHLGLQVEGGIQAGTQSPPRTEPGALSLLAGTVPRLSLGIRPLPRGEVQPNRFHVSVNRMEPRDLARHGLTLLAGRGESSALAPLGLFESSSAESLEATLDGGISLDGELFALPEPTRVRVTAGPSVRFWVPS